MRTLLITVALASLLVGCKDYGRCLASHEETQLMTIIVGKVAVPIFQTIDVCDRYEFPEGRE